MYSLFGEWWSPSFKQRLERVLCPIDVTVKDIVPAGPLPVDTRHSIYKKAFTDLGPEWLRELESMHPGVDLAPQWNPDRYQKNILGQMIDIADRTSPLCLTPDGLAQTIRHVHRCLFHDLVALGVDAPDARIGEMVAWMVPDVSRMWHESRKQLGDVMDRQGGHQRVSVTPPLPQVSYYTSETECRGVGKDELRRRRDHLLKNLRLDKA